MLIIYLRLIKKIEKSDNRFIDNLRSTSSSLTHSVDNLSEINEKIEKSENLLITLEQRLLHYHIVLIIYL